MYYLKTYVTSKLPFIGQIQGFGENLKVTNKQRKKNIAMGFGVLWWLYWMHLSH